LAFFFTINNNDARPNKYKIQYKRCSQSRYITYLPEVHPVTRIKLLTKTDDSHTSQN